MHRMPLTSILAGLLLLSASSSASLAQSVVDMTRQTGASKFVSGSDGKPAQIGVPVPGKRRDASPIVQIVSGNPIARQSDPPKDADVVDTPDEPALDNQSPASQPNSPDTSATPTCGSGCDDAS